MVVEAAYDFVMHVQMMGELLRFSEEMGK